jgi:glutathione synthase/RimK-type ligase-like ATP-grasp enzyme
MADTNIAKDIVKLNADVATAFGVFLSGVDIISTIPSNAHCLSLFDLFLLQF